MCCDLRDLSFNILWKKKTTKLYVLFMKRIYKKGFTVCIFVLKKYEAILPEKITHLSSARSFQVAEWLPTLDDEVLGSNPVGGAL